ncbi:hypothetical protein ACFL4Y_00040 [Gemmatimonadota bacterium]
MDLRRAALLPLLLLALAGCEGLNIIGTDTQDQEASAAFSYSVDASTASSFNLANVTGDVRIVGVPGLDSIRVTGVRRVRASTQTLANANLPLLTVNIQQLEGTVSVQTDFPSGTNNISFIVDYECEIPADLAVNVVNVTGPVTCESLENGLHGSVVTGDVLLSEITGNILLSVITGSVEGWVTVAPEGSCVISVVTGGIDVQLLTFPAGSACSMEVVTGTLRLGIPVTTSASFTGTVVTGSISLQNLDLQNPVVTASSTSGQLGDGGATISLAVITGSIQVVGATNFPGS